MDADTGLAVALGHAVAAAVAGTHILFFLLLYFNMRVLRFFLVMPACPFVRPAAWPRRLFFLSFFFPRGWREQRKRSRKSLRRCHHDCEQQQPQSKHRLTHGLDLTYCHHRRQHSSCNIDCSNTINIFSLISATTDVNATSNSDPAPVRGYLYMRGLGLMAALTSFYLLFTCVVSFFFAIKGSLDINMASSAGLRPSWAYVLTVRD